MKKSTLTMLFLALFNILLPDRLVALDLDLVLRGSYATGEHPQAVAVSGNYAYVAGSRWTGSNYVDGLQVIDISNPANPQRVGGYDTGWGASGVVVSGNYAYLTVSTTWCGKKVCRTVPLRLEVIDISNPANPQRVADCDTGGEIQAVAVSGNYAYVAEGSCDNGGVDGGGCWGGPLHVIDISNPANPQRVGRFDLSGFPNGVAVSGNYAYVMEQRWTGSTLQVVDVSDPANPQRVGGIDTSGSAWRVAVSGNYAYVAGYGLQVIDVSNPSNPQRVGGYNTSDISRASEVAVSGNYAFVAEQGWTGSNYVRSLHVIDVSNPANPRRVGFHDTSGNDWRGWDVAVSGNYVCVADWDAGLQVIEINPANPQRLGGYDTSGLAQAVAVSGGYAYVADGDAGLQVINVSDQANPQRVGGYDTNGSALDIAVSGNFAYVADGFAGLQLIDVSNPANPQPVGGHDTGGYALGVAVSGNFASVADYYGGLQVIDVSAPTNPQWVGDYFIGGDRGAHGVAVSGKYAYVTETPYFCVGCPHQWGALIVVDISNPANPQRVGGHDTSGSALDVAVSGNYAYVADGDAGLQVIDVSNPANPQRVGGHNTSGAALDVAVSGNFAYVAAGDAGLQVIDVSNPANPRRVGGNNLFYAQGVTVANGKVFVAAGEQGLFILDLFRPLRLEPLRGSAPGTFGVRVDGPRGVTARLQRSTNLADWEDWIPVNLGENSVEVLDSDTASAPALFYRLALP